MAFTDFLGSMFGGGGDQSSGLMPQPQQSEGFDFGKLVMPLLIGGGSALASKLMGRGIDKDISRAEKNLRSGSDVARKAGETMVQRGSEGRLTDPQQAQVDRMKAEQGARWNQYLSNLGIPVSSSQVQAQNLVDTQATELANKLINESFGQGLEALKLGTTASQAMLQNALAQRQDLTKRIWDVASEIGRVLNEPDKQPGQAQQSVQTEVPPEWAGLAPEFQEQTYA